MNNGFYILEDEEQRGPFSFNELMRMDLDPQTQILTPVAEEWQYAFDIPELYPYFQARGIYFPTADNLASFGWRLLAWIVDMVLISILANLLLPLLSANKIIPNIQMRQNVFDMPPADLQIIQLVIVALLIVYNTICEASPLKGSLGKKLCRLVVVDVDGYGLSFFSALLRSIGKVISLSIFNIGFLFVFFTEYKQALHDKFAKSYVVKL